MTWELIVSYLVTIAAVPVGFGFAFYLMWKSYYSIVKKMLANHIDSPYCHCEWCKQQNISP